MSEKVKVCIIKIHEGYTYHDDYSDKLSSLVDKSDWQEVSFGELNQLNEWCAKNNGANYRYVLLQLEDNENFPLKIDEIIKLHKKQKKAREKEEAEAKAKQAEAKAKREAKKLEKARKLLEEAGQL